MRFFLLISFFAILAAAQTGLAESRKASGGSCDETIVFIRHGEKPCQ